MNLVSQNIIMRERERERESCLWEDQYCFEAPYGRHTIASSHSQHLKQQSTDSVPGTPDTFKQNTKINKQTRMRNYSISSHIIHLKAKVVNTKTM